MTDQVNGGSVWESDVVTSFENESSGGRGWICYANISFGYKLFASGHSNKETFFAWDINVDGDKERARAAADAFRDKINASGGSVKPPSSAIQIEIDIDNVYGYDTSNWQDNRIFTYPVWTDAYKKVVRPSLKEANAILGWQWLRLSFKEDPRKPEYEDPLTGEMRVNLVPYVAEVFPTKQAALDAAADGAGNTASTKNDGDAEPAFDSDEFIPELYDATSWALVKSDILKAKAEGISPKQIADDYGLTIPEVMKVK